MSGRVHSHIQGHSGITTKKGIDGIVVKNEGGAIGIYSTINFIGADVTALPGAGQADIYIPAITYSSHWNTSDGDNGATGQ